MSQPGSRADLSERAGLSEAKRKLLEQRLRQATSGGPSAERIPPRQPGTRIPMSAEQHRIWIHSQQQPDVPVYNDPLTILRRGSFNLQTMEDAFNEILRRHEAWRTSIAVVDGQLSQVVHDNLRVKLHLDDLTHLPVEERESEALRISAEDAHVPIALDEVPLFRTRVLKLADDDHRLHLTMHHIIFDGVSFYRVMLPELAAIYDAYEKGEPSPLPEPTLQYGDYSLWREEHLKSKSIARQVDYWKQQLSGELPVLRLPMDRPRPATVSNRGSVVQFKMPHTLAARIHDFSKQHGATLYMTMLAAFKALMFRYSGQEDVLIGGTTDARRREEFENLMGYFLDTFAVRSQPHPDTTFENYLVEVKKSLLGAFENSAVPFDRVVQAVRPRRDPSYHPLFQAFFSIQPLTGSFPAGWDINEMDVITGATKFDIYMELAERADQHWDGRVIYNTDIFDAATMHRMTDHWQVLLEAVCDNPSATLASLPILTPAEQADLATWNATERPYPQQPLPALLQSTAASTKTAVTFGTDYFTYRQLDMRANFLAQKLQAAGATSGELVAVLLPRSLDLLAGLIAVMKTGAAYLPLDPDVPRARTEQCLNEAKPAVVLTTAALQQTFATSAQAVLADEPGERNTFTADVALDDSAYVIHTSGSTGVPKGVEITHRNLINLLESMRHAPGFAVQDTMLAVTTVSFDIAGLELFLPLLACGRLVIASREEALDPQLLAALIESSGCTVMQATPSTWRALLGSGWRGASRPLRILCGGEPLPRELAEQLLTCNAQLWNMYGPTETTVWSTIDRVQSSKDRVSIGGPIANTTTYLLDAQHNVLPIGAAGELYIGGTGVAVGYRGRPELTHDRFLTIRGERLYRTGDLAVRRSDGRVECLGRIDNQVKVRGFRVELEAVEAHACKHPDVDAAAATTWPEASGGNRLSLYIVARPGVTAPDAYTMRRFIGDRLPDYMVPSDVMELPELPLTSNGKTDRAALPQPIRQSRATSVPTTNLECKIAAIWCELLGVTEVDVDANFFDLGGHSLLVADLQQRITITTGRRITMAALFHAPSIREQAAIIEREMRGQSLPAGIVALQPMGTRTPLFWLHAPPAMRNLLDALGDDQPVFGVVLTSEDMQALGPKPTFEAIAATHARAIVAMQPHGPIQVGGLCTGGILAYAVAHELEKLGRGIDVAVMLDSINPVFFRRVDSLPVELSKIRFHMKRSYLNGERHGAVSMGRRLLARITAGRKAMPINATEMTAEQLMTDIAALAYKPGPSTWPALLLQPRERPAKVDYIPGWKPLAKNLIAQDVNGHHDELLRPENATSVAEAIAAHLQTR